MARENRTEKRKTKAVTFDKGESKDEGEDDKGEGVDDQDVGNGE